MPIIIAVEARVRRMMMMSMMIVELAEDVESSLNVDSVTFSYFSPWSFLLSLRENICTHKNSAQVCTAVDVCGCVMQKLSNYVCLFLSRQGSIHLTQEEEKNRVLPPTSLSLLI